MVSALAAAVGLGINVQLALSTLVSLALFASSRTLFKKAFIRSGDRVRTGVEAMLGTFAPPVSYTGPLAGEGPSVLFHGVRESLHNVVLARVLSVLAAIFASVGAWRVSRRLTPEPALAP